MAVLVLTNSLDTHIELVARHLGDRCFRLNTDVPFELRFHRRTTHAEVSQGDWRVDLNHLDGLWNRRAFTEIAAETPIQRFNRLEAKATLLASCVQAVPPIRWVNAPTANRLASNKPWMLRAAECVGLTVPDWCCTNDSTLATSVMDRWGGTAVLKPLANPVEVAMEVPNIGYARLIRSAELKVLTQSQSILPIFLQQPIAKIADIRVNVIDDHVEAARMVAPDGAAIDFRKNYELLHYEPYVLPDSVTHSPTA